MFTNTYLLFCMTLGKGAVGQLSLETLLPRPLIGGLIVGLVCYACAFDTCFNPCTV